MANRVEILKKLNELKGTEKIGDLVTFMVEKGFTSEEWDRENVDASVLNAFVEFFGETLDEDGSNEKKDAPMTAKEKAKAQAKARADANAKLKADAKEKKRLLAEEKEKARLKAIDDAKAKTDEDNKNNDGKIPVQDTPITIKNKYKTIHNLITETKAKETILEKVQFSSDLGEDIIYQTTLNGSQLVEMFMDGTLVFDPSMQRGIKEDVNGQVIANFTDSHVKDIAKAMELNQFSPSLIELAIITSDENLEYNYDEENARFSIVGLLRLLDGQHRIRAMVMLNQLMKVSKLDKDFNLAKYVFPIQVHITSAEFARIIYNNINKMRKLDKSQSRQLSSDRYAKITNRLNIYSDSPLKEKIATSKPVGNKLVLFSTIAEQLQKTVKATTGSEIESNRQMEEVQAYLFKFFDYVAYKMPNAFGSDGKSRVEFRENNLLNENNFFEAWIELALADKENYEKNIDKIAENIEFFNKDAKVVIDGVEVSKWEKLNSVKAKSSGSGFAMANTSTGKKNLVKQTLELVGIAK